MCALYSWEVLILHITEQQQYVSAAAAAAAADCQFDLNRQQRRTLQYRS